MEMLRSLIDERFGLVGRRDPNGKAKVYTLVLTDPERLGPGIRHTDVACVNGKNASPTATSFHPLHRRSRAAWDETPA
jgi:hypothetical protein